MKRRKLTKVREQVGDLMLQTLIVEAQSYRQILVMVRPVRRRRLWADGQVWR